jgi:hypothetical protein
MQVRLDPSEVSPYLLRDRDLQRHALKWLLSDRDPAALPVVHPIPITFNVTELHQLATNFMNGENSKDNASAITEGDEHPQGGDEDEHMRDDEDSRQTREEEKEAKRKKKKSTDPHVLAGREAKKARKASGSKTLRIRGGGDEPGEAEGDGARMLLSDDGHEEGSVHAPLGQMTFHVHAPRESKYSYPTPSAGLQGMQGAEVRICRCTTRMHAYMYGASQALLELRMENKLSGMRGGAVDSESEQDVTTSSSIVSSDTESDEASNQGSAPARVGAKQVGSSKAKVGSSAQPGRTLPSSVPSPQSPPSVSAKFSQQTTGMQSGQPRNIHAAAVTTTGTSSSTRVKSDKGGAADGLAKQINKLKMNEQASSEDLISSSLAGGSDDLSPSAPGKKHSKQHSLDKGKQAPKTTSVPTHVGPAGTSAGVKEQRGAPSKSAAHVPAAKQGVKSAATGGKVSDASSRGRATAGTRPLRNAEGSDEQSSSEDGSSANSVSSSVSESSSLEGSTSDSNMSSDMKGNSKSRQKQRKDILLEKGDEDAEGFVQEDVAMRTSSEVSGDESESLESSEEEDESPDSRDELSVFRDESEEAAFANDKTAKQRSVCGGAHVLPFVYLYMCMR